MNRKTDYVALAKLLEQTAKKCDMNMLDQAIKWAFEQKGPIVIETAIDCDEKVLPMIPPNGTINDIILKG